MHSTATHGWLSIEMQISVESMTLQEFLAFMDVYWPHVETLHGGHEKSSNRQVNNIFSGTNLWSPSTHKTAASALRHTLTQAVKIDQTDKRMIHSVFTKLDSDNSGELYVRPILPECVSI